MYLNQAYKKLRTYLGDSDEEVIAVGLPTNKGDVLVYKLDKAMAAMFCVERAEVSKRSSPLFWYEEFEQFLLRSMLVMPSDLLRNDWFLWTDRFRKVQEGLKPKETKKQQPKTQFINSNNFLVFKDYAANLFEKTETKGYLQLVTLNRKVGVTYSRDWVSNVDELELAYKKAELLLQMSPDARVYVTYNLAHITKNTLIATATDYLNCLKDGESQSFGRTLLDKMSSNMVKSQHRGLTLYDVDTKEFQYQNNDFELCVPTPKGYHVLAKRTGKEEPIPPSEIVENKGCNSLLLLAWNEV